MRGGKILPILRCRKLQMVRGLAYNTQNFGPAENFFADHKKILSRTGGFINIMALQMHSYAAVSKKLARSTLLRSVYSVERSGSRIDPYERRCPHFAPRSQCFSSLSHRYSQGVEPASPTEITTTTGTPPNRHSGTANTRATPEKKSHVLSGGKSTKSARDKKDRGSTGKTKQKEQEEEKKKKPEEWQIQKQALKEKFKEGWNPLKKVSPDAMEGIRELHAMAPEKFTTRVLSQEFKISPEAIRRILKSKWRPSEEVMEDRRRRWLKRYDRIYSYMTELGLRPAQRHQSGYVSDANMLYGNKTVIYGKKYKKRGE